MSRPAVRLRPVRLSTRLRDGAPGTRLPLTGRTGMLPVMARAKMHADEIHSDAALVRWLLGRQFRQWADLPVTLVPSYGTDHDIYDSASTSASGCRASARRPGRRPRKPSGCPGLRRTFRWPGRLQSPERWA